MRPYDALARVYDDWTAGNDYGRWARYIVDVASLTVGSSVLDLCCGTGRLTRQLHDAGMVVTGVDVSRPMLDRAARTLPEETVLLERDLARADLDLGVENGAFDACVCSFDSLNYFTDERALRAVFDHAAAALRPGGVLVFDVNTRHKLADVFGDSHYGDDLDDFAYVWRNRYDPESRSCRFLISLYIRDGDVFVRAEETHVQRWFERSELVGAAERAGLAVLAVTDDYTDRPAGSQSLRETWVVQKESRG